MRTILHITHKKNWEQAKARGEYTADTLESEGFIHLSRPHQVLRVANHLFKGQSDLVLLHVNQERVREQIKYEGADGDHFPHIYGPLNLDAVIDVYDFPESPEGFCLPEELTMVGDTLIRVGRPGDEAEIASCHTHAWQQSYPGLVPDSILAARPLSFRSRLSWWRSIVAGEGPHSVVVAESKEHGIVGFCAVGPGRDEDMDGKGEIGAIYLLNQYKRKGLGAALLHAGCAKLRARDYSAVYLWVLKDNPTIGFYEKMGGTRTSREKTIELGALLKEVQFEWNL